MKLLICLPLLLWRLLDHASGVDTVRVSVMEGDPVTLNTGVKINQQYSIRWSYNGIRIAESYRHQSEICTEVQCKERFRDRLKLDHQTGSLIITNTRNTDAGFYTLTISSRSSEIFLVSVHGASAIDTVRVSVLEGDSVTLNTDVQTNQHDRIRWYYNDTLIAEITGDQSQICTDVQCEERFRDRLKLDHQTGSLTITNTRNTDSGEYKLQINIINNSSFSISRVKRFSVSVIDSGLSSGVVAGIFVVVLLVSAAVTAAAVIYCCCRQSHTEVPQNEGDEDNSTPHDPNGIPLRTRTHTSDSD